MKQRDEFYMCVQTISSFEQIEDRAKGIGLNPATRYKSTWRSREDFENGNTFCVTNYASVFHGYSIFRNDDVDALIFDDAHVAENVIRGQFTLKIPNNHVAFNKILHIFRDHFANSSQAERFEDISQGRFTLYYSFLCLSFGNTSATPKIFARLWNYSRQQYQICLGASKRAP